MPTPSPTTKYEVTFREIFRPIWAERRRVVIISFIVALLTLGINFLLPKYYKANATIIPETDKNKLSSMGSLAGLASLAGVNVPSGDISRLYPVILTSESVLTAVIERRYATTRFQDSVNLIQYMELDEGSDAKNLDAALRTLKDLLVVNIDAKTSVVTASVEMREPRLAADVLNASLVELDLFLREKKSTSATEQRKWIESRLVQVNLELRTAEDALKTFREKNHQVSSPQLLLEQERLAREVQVKASIDLELRKQAEIAKIDEIKQIATINVLDEGREPVKKERPKRATNAVIVFLLTLVATSGYFAVHSIYGLRIREYFNSLTSQSHRQLSS
jgi:uncharacterized protein involved in exopolysaccharide biosynthesis